MTKEHARQQSVQCIAAYVQLMHFLPYGVTQQERRSPVLSLRRPLEVLPSLEGREGRGSTLLWGMTLSMLKVRLDPPGLSWDMGVKSVSSSPSSSCSPAHACLEDKLYESLSAAEANRLHNICSASAEM